MCTSALPASVVRDISLCTTLSIGACSLLLHVACWCVPVSVQVHFDCRFRGIDAVSSRYARTLGGNRTIAEVRPETAAQKAVVAAACAALVL